jgi:phosphatidylserine/phosphatidylglycerophosphate/cardiolipin synthase-like enzyme
VVEEKFYNTDTNIIQEFKNHSIELHALESDKLHGKAILVDDKYLYIGSVNFSSYSFDNNREIGVIISDPQIVLKFKKIFESDF